MPDSRTDDQITELLQKSLKETLKEFVDEVRHIHDHQEKFDEVLQMYTTKITELTFQTDSLGNRMDKKDISDDDLEKRVEELEKYKFGLTAVVTFLVTVGGLVMAVWQYFKH